MGRRPPRRGPTKPPEPPEDPFDPEDGEDEGDALGELLDGLDGGETFTASVRRQADTGEWASCLNGTITIPPGMTPDKVIDTLGQRWGAGKYHLQLRRRGTRGTIGNVYTSIYAPPASSPAAGSTSDIVAVMEKHNTQTLGMLREVLASKAAPAAPPGATLEDQLKGVGRLFTFAQGLSRSAASPQMPAWLEQIGQAAGPVVHGLGRLLTGMAQRKPPGPAGATPQSVIPAVPPADSIEPLPDEPAADEAPDEEAQLKMVLRFVARAPNPDPDTYASLALDAAGDSIRTVLATMPVGTLAAAMVEQVPELASKSEFCTKLEEALRARVAKPAA